MKDFRNPDRVMNEWWDEYEAFLNEVVKVKKLTKASISVLRNIRIKI